MIEESKFDDWINNDPASTKFTDCLPLTDWLLHSSGEFTFPITFISDATNEGSLFCNTFEGIAALL